MSDDTKRFVRRVEKLSVVAVCLSVKRVPVKVVCVKVRAVHWQRVQLTRARKVNNFVKLKMTNYTLLALPLFNERQAKK